MSIQLIDFWAGYRLTDLHDPGHVVGHTDVDVLQLILIVIALLGVCVRSSARYDQVDNLIRTFAHWSSLIRCHSFFNDQLALDKLTWLSGGGIAILDGELQSCRDSGDAFRHLRDNNQDYDNGG